MKTARGIQHLADSSGWLCVGLFAAGLCCVGCPPPGEPAPAGPGPAATQPVKTAPKDIEKLARTDHVKLLKLALERCKRDVRSYTCTFIKRERMRGKFGKAQHVKVKFKEDPFSVAMAWVKNPPRGDRALYVEGRNNGLMLVRPTGLGWLFGTVGRNPKGKEVMAQTLRPITMFGFRRSLASLLKVYEPAVRRGEAVNTFEGYEIIAGRSAMKLVRTLPKRDDYPAGKTVIYLSVDRLLPIRLEGYDWDGKLFCEYEYRDVDFSAKLTDADFTPEANDLKPLKK